jgi:3-hydroxyisobutyrate dehydrogenase
MKSVAFIGLGNMGGSMAANLINAGHSLTVFDLVSDAVERAVALGASAAPSAADAARECDAVVTMLPASQHVRDLYLGEGRLLESAKPGALLIDCSTIAPATAKEVAAAAASRGMEMIDAPVSGGVAGAAAGTLTFIVGGEAEALGKARPLLEAMGKAVFHAGASGAGQTAKICNNMLLAIHMIGTCEAIRLGVASGLDPNVLSDIMTKSSGRNWSLELYNPYPGVMEHAPASRDYQGGFLTDLMLKDLGLAMEAAQAAGAVTPLGTHAQELYAAHSRSGAGKLDFSSIFRLLEDAQLP